MKNLRIVAALLILGTALAQAQQGGAPLLSAVSGTVEIQEGPDQPWKSASAGAELKEGASLRTGPDGRAQVTFPDKAVIWLKESTSFGVQSNLPLTRKIQVSQGEVKASIPHLKRKQTFEVHTANAVAAVRGTQFTVRTTPEGGIDIKVAFGEVRMHLLAEAKTISIPQGQTYRKEEGVAGKLTLMNKDQEKEVLIDWSPGLSEGQRDAALNQKTEDRSDIKEFSRQAEAQQESINNLVAQVKNEDFAAGRTLVDVHGNLTRVDQKMLRPDANSLQFVNLVKRPTYNYRDNNPYGQVKPWTYTGAQVTDRLDSLQAFVKFDQDLPQDLVEWPSFFSSNDVKLKTADMVMTNQFGGPTASDIFVMGSFAENCQLATSGATCFGKYGQDTLEGAIYVGNVNQLSDVRDTTKLIRMDDVADVTSYSADGEGPGILFSHEAAPLQVAGGSAYAWFATETYVIDNGGQIKTSNDFANSGKDPFTLLKETAGQVIFFLKATSGGAFPTNTTGSNPNIAAGGGAATFAPSVLTGPDFKYGTPGSSQYVNATGRNIDLVIIPDLAVSIIQRIGGALGDINTEEKSVDSPPPGPV